MLLTNMGFAEIEIRALWEEERSKCFYKSTFPPWLEDGWYFATLQMVLLTFWLVQGREVSWESLLCLFRGPVWGRWCGESGDYILLSMFPPLLCTVRQIPCPSYLTSCLSAQLFSTWQGFPYLYSQVTSSEISKDYIHRREIVLSQCTA